MSAGCGANREAVMAAYDELEAAQEKVATLSYDRLTHFELLGLESRRETMRRREPAADSLIDGIATAQANHVSPTHWVMTSASFAALRKLKIANGRNL